MPFASSLLAALCAGISVILFVIGAGRNARGDAVQQRMDRLLSRRSIIDQDELHRPLLERLLRPLRGKMGGFARRLSSGNALEKMQRAIDKADLNSTFDASTFMALRFFAACGAGLSFAVLALLAHGGIFQVILGGGGAAMAAYIMPIMWVQGKAKARQSEIRLAMPDMLDMLTLCTGVMSLDRALDRVSANSPPTLRSELNRVSFDLRTGAYLDQALQRFADRVGLDEMNTLIATINQSRQLGTPMEQVLRDQSADMRVRRRQRAEKLAREAPIKMMFPLVIFVFPPLFIVLLGPTIPQILHSLAPGIHL
jgi:tight adherence protein C